MNTDTPNRPIRCVAHVSREYLGLAGAGGIKDVTEGLARAAAAAGVETHVFLPYYSFIDQGISVKDGPAFDIRMNYPTVSRTESVRIRTHLPDAGLNLQVHLVESDRFKYLQEGAGKIERRRIYTYSETEAAALGNPSLSGKGHFDYFAMNVLLVKATLRHLANEDIRPDIIHCHDGHASLLPLIAQEAKVRFSASEERHIFPPYLRYTPTLTTVHNAGQGHHQEVADLEFAASICDVSTEIVKTCLLGNQFDPLLAGALFGSAINTVSENYARELQHTGQDWMTGWLGHALAGYGIKLHGITNGVDPSSFSPEHPECLKLGHSFSPEKGEFDGKEFCKAEILNGLAEGRFPDSIPPSDVVNEKGVRKLEIAGAVKYEQQVPLLTFVGRFSRQKGYDILAEALRQLLAEDAHVHVLGLGSGDKGISQDLRILASDFFGRVCVVEGYSEQLANHVFAAGDFFLVPSMFEPCGLTDFYAQLVGNVPIVHRVGGLVKTLDGQFGYSYLGGAGELLETVHRALAAYREAGRPEIRRIQMQAVQNIFDNFTWEKVFSKYVDLYQNAIKQTQPKLPYSCKRRV